MSLKKIAVAFATMSLLVGTALAAPNMVGTWKGKVKLDMSKATGPQMLQLMQKQAASVSKLTVMISLAKDGTFSLKYVGTTLPPGAHPVQGTWSSKGYQLTLNPVIPQRKVPPQTMTVAKNGKSFSLSQAGGAIVTTFTR